MKSALVPTLLVTVLVAAWSSAFASTTTDDRDLSPRRQRILGQVPLEIPADEVRTSAGEGLLVEVLRDDGKRLSPVIGLLVQIQNERTQSRAVTDSSGAARFAKCEGKIRFTGQLENEKVKIAKSGDAYQIFADIPCQGKVQILFKRDSHGGQALGIWQVAERGRAKLAESVGLAFWKKQLEFVWPSEGDYYSWGEVNITAGHQWDVVGHEMGHAIYDMGDLGQFGGGPHKIDECYSSEMALSEGWASYFSGWVNLDLADPDARFEFMVPRRAPIRFENIPADVCQGETNEWRVNGFFWDLIDLHDDGEAAIDTFALIWKAMFNSRVASASEARLQLERSGLNPQLLALVWDLNFSH